MAPRRIVLLMRGNLTGEIEAPHWPHLVSPSTFTNDNAEAAHTVLGAGYYEGGGGAPDFQKWMDQLRRDAEFDPALCFVANDMLGVCGICLCWTSGFVKDLAVHPRVRRSGVGRALMLTAFHTFRSRGATHVDLKVREENAAAQRLYRYLDMVEVAREPE